MREFDALRSYPQSAKVLASQRGIRNRIIACHRDREFFDGSRENGYGGYAYDGRWEPVARDICEEYRLDNEGSVLQLGCEKGFLMHELLKLYPLMRVRGIETSLYARNNAMPEIRLGIRLERYQDIMPFDRKEFDLVIAIGVVYTLNLRDAIFLLKEISRVGKRCFITLGAYENDDDYKLLRDWTLLGTTILRKDEWQEVMRHAGYVGDYKFVTAQSLGLGG